jgi:hypothetical protein
VKLVINGIVAALLAIWSIPIVFGGTSMPAAYGWFIALLFVAGDMSYVSLQLARVEAQRSSAR